MCLTCTVPAVVQDWDGSELEWFAHVLRIDRNEISNPDVSNIYQLLTMNSCVYVTKLFYC
jgi:hypothetical protein